MPVDLPFPKVPCDTCSPPSVVYLGTTWSSGCATIAHLTPELNLAKMMSEIHTKICSVSDHGDDHGEHIFVSVRVHVCVYLMYLRFIFVVIYTCVFVSVYG